MSASASKKRTLEEDQFEDLGEMTLSKSAKVHGVISELSPMKNTAAGTSKYFHGQLTDGKTRRRIFGFDSKIHQRLADFHQSKEAVALTNCEVKEGKYSSELELLVRKSTDVEKSPTKIDASKLIIRSGSHVALEEISGLCNYQSVVVRVKVVNEDEAVEVKKDLVKQDYVVADATGACRMTTWNENVGILEQGMSYELSGVIVRTYGGKKYLSVSKEEFQAVSIDDIGEVEGDNVELLGERKLKNVMIVGVKYFETYDGCYACKGKVMPRSEILGDCNRCGSTQRLDRCKQLTTVKLDVESDSELRSLSAFSPVIEDICQGDASMAALLCSEAFDLVYSEKNVILSITRE